MHMKVQEEVCHGDDYFHIWGVECSGVFLSQRKERKWEISGTQVPASKGAFNKPLAVYCSVTAGTNTAAPITWKPSAKDWNVCGSTLLMIQI